MKNKRKQKRRLKKSIKHRQRERIKRDWRNIFVKAGILE
jgi:hypothetical protein